MRRILLLAVVALAALGATACDSSYDSYGGTGSTGSDPMYSSEVRDCAKDVMAQGYFSDASQARIACGTFDKAMDDTDQQLEDELTDEFGY